MNAGGRAVLLDTCAVIWLANGDDLAETAMAAILQAGREGGIHVSPISAWEIGMLGRARPGRSAAVSFRPDPKTWFARFLSGPAIKLAELTPEIAIDASWLPGELHADPADRLIVATARYLGMPVVTRDQRIIAYRAAGFIDVWPC